MNDLELISAELAANSLSNCEIVLAYDDVMKAIEHLTANGYFVFAWEGWIKHPDGKHGHSRQHQGTHCFWGTDGHPVEQRIKEAALFAQETIQKSQREWNENPEIAGGILCFCLSVEAPLEWRFRAIKDKISILRRGVAAHFLN